MAWSAQQSPLRPPLWRDRRQAGLALAGLLGPWQRRPGALVIGLPRGGVVVAAVVAQALQLPLASWSVRKLAHPAAPELALGAIAPGGVLLWEGPDRQPRQLDPALGRQLLAEADQELRRRQQLYGDPAASALNGRPLLVVDDGVATGLSLRAALQSLQQAGALERAVAVPVIDRRVLQRLASDADGITALAVVDQLGSVGRWFEQFGAVADQEVIQLLAAGRAPQG